MATYSMPATESRTSNREDPAALRASDRAAGARRLVLFVLALAAAGLIAWKVGLFDLSDRATMVVAVERARTMPFLIPAFVVAYAIAVTFALPASAFTLAGGALFGFWGGLGLNWIGATLGAVLAYLFAGALCGPGCRALLGSRADVFERLAERHGLLGTLRLRLIPVIPFALLNYGAALAGVRFRDYLIATAFGMLPGTAVYTYFADSLLRGVAGVRQNALLHVAVAGVILILLSFLPALTRRVGRART